MDVHTHTHTHTHAQVYEGASDKDSIFKDPKEPERYVMLTFTTLSYLGLTL